MDRKKIEAQIFDNYERDEQMMILVFAQWCVNHQLDPAELYQQAYPQQGPNCALQQAIKLTVPKEEAGDLPDDTVLGVLSLYNNDQLAFIVTEAIKNRVARAKAVGDYTTS
jgi:hypothetical protein